MTKAVSYIENDIMILKLPNSVSLNILDSLLEELNKTDQHNFILDFSNVKYIDPEGALSLICFCCVLKSDRLNRNNSDIKIHFIYPSENVLNYLTRLGFFGQMGNKAGISDRQDIIHFENELRQERRLKQKTYSNQLVLKPIILPIETIPQQNSELNSRDFENVSRTFVNHAIDSFTELFTSPHYNFDSAGEHNFLLSNVELYKNIYEHSRSWGIASIHARPNYGTTVCYYDIGIGFKTSIGKFDNEQESIEWALIDGNSSRPGDDNDGFGLTIVQDFVLSRKGNIKIRSGDCLMQINSSSKQKNSVPRFPGVQLSYFIPI